MNAAVKPVENAHACHLWGGQASPLGGRFILFNTVSVSGEPIILWKTRRIYDRIALSVTKRHRKCLPIPRGVPKTPENSRFYAAVFVISGRIRPMCFSLQGLETM